MNHAIGFAGSILILLAYIPQIYHLIRERCSAGISRYAYLLWLLGAVALLAHSVMIGDAVFIFLQSMNAACTGMILLFAAKYRGACPAHRLKQ